MQISIKDKECCCKDKGKFAANRQPSTTFSGKTNFYASKKSNNYGQASGKTK